MEQYQTPYLVFCTRVYEELQLELQMGPREQLFLVCIRVTIRNWHSHPAPIIHTRLAILHADMAVVDTNNGHVTKYDYI